MPRLLAAKLFLALSLAPSALAQETIYSAVLPPQGTAAIAMVPTRAGGLLLVSPSTLIAVNAEGVETGRVVIPDGPQTTIKGACADGRGGAWVLYDDSTQVASTLRDGVLLRTDERGVTLQSTRIGGTGNDFSRGIASDGVGGVYVVGRTTSDDFGSPTIAGANDAFVARFDATGAEQWVERIGDDVDPSRLAEFRSVSSDGAGGALVGGVTFALSGFPATFGTLIARFDASGQLAWRHAELGTRSRVAAVERTNSGGYVEFRILLDGGYECIIRDPLGARIADVDLVPNNTSDDEASSLTRIEDGTFALGGRRAHEGGSLESYLLIFDEFGARLREEFYPTGANRSSGILALASDSMGSVFIGDYVAGTFTTSGRARRIAVAAAGRAGCAAQPNSTGVAAETQLVGSPDRIVNELLLLTTGVPVDSVGFYLGSLTSGFTPGAGGSQGDLCLGGTIGRFSRAGEVRSALSLGRIHLQLDLSDFPSPTGSVSTMAGENWHFQAWYRDLNPTATSNFSSSTSILLR
jgi:hypothetical protein